MVLRPKSVSEADLTALEPEEIAMVVGDLSVLTAEQRKNLYAAVCKSVGLNPFTRPFDYLSLNNKLVLYARKDATDQLRSLHGISVEKLERSTVEGIFIVTAYGRDRVGRTDSSMGAVPLPAGNNPTEAKANAMMKAETKAKRRLTLSLAGLGFLDETEVGSIEGARTVTVDDDGVINGTATEVPKPPASLAEALDRADAPDDLPPPPTVAPDGLAPAPAAPEATPAPESPPESTTAPDGVVASEPEKVGLTGGELKEMAKEKHILPAVLLSKAHEMFGVTALPDLDDGQRLALWMVVRSDN